MPMSRYLDDVKTKVVSNQLYCKHDVNSIYDTV